MDTNTVFPGYRLNFVCGEGGGGGGGGGSLRGPKRFPRLKEGGRGDENKMANELCRLV